MDLSEAVRQLRRELGESQQAFATRLDLSISAIVNYEGGRAPTGRALMALARAAEDAGNKALTAVFLAGLAGELGLHKNIGVLHSSKLGGFLFLSLEGEEQQDVAYDFYNAFLVHFHSERYHKAPSPEAQGAAGKRLRNLKAGAVERKR